MSIVMMTDENREFGDYRVNRDARYIPPTGVSEA